MYQALLEGEVVCEGTYQECLEAVGYCNEEGWFIPEWRDAGIVEKY